MLSVVEGRHAVVMWNDKRGRSVMWFFLRTEHKRVSRVVGRLIRMSFYWRGRWQIRNEELAFNGERLLW